MAALLRKDANVVADIVVSAMEAECGHINSVGPDGSPRRCRGGGARNRHG